MAVGNAAGAVSRIDSAGQARTRVGHPVDRSVTDASVVSQFLVPADSPGLRVEQTWDSLGMRATCSWKGSGA